MGRIFLFLAALGAVIGMWAALHGVRSGATGRADLRAGGRGPDVVATTGIIADLARSVGGDRARVTALMGPGVDPHLFEASEGDVTRMGGADLILYGGLHLEGRMSEVLERLSHRGVPCVAVTSRLAPERLIRSGPGGTPDPHIWHDVALWMEAARSVRDALARVDPSGAAGYAARCEAYLAELARLDAEVRERLRAVPRGRRVLVTPHDAFAYFGRAYDVEVRGIQGISTVTEAGVRDIREVADLIARRRIPAIFVESSVSPRVIEALQAAVGALGFEVAIGDALLSDALGDPGTPEGTYAGMIRHNVAAIVRGLRPGGEDP